MNDRPLATESGSRDEMLEEIRALRRQLVELEIEAGILPPRGHVVDARSARQALAVLRGLMKTLLVGFAVGNARGRIVDANEAFARLLGTTRDELLDAQLTWKRITPPEYAEADRVARETMQRTGLPHSYRKEYLRRDGTRVPVLICVIHTTDVRDEHGVLVLDDSARQMAEESWRQAEGMYQRVLDAIPDLVLLRDSAARIVWANQAFLAFHGTTQQALAGSLAPPGQPPETLEGELRDEAVVLETGMPVDLPRQSRTRADGVPRILHVVKSPVTGDVIHVVRSVSFARDVSDRARAEAALQRSEANLKTAQALAHVGSYSCRIPYRGDDEWSEEMYSVLDLPREGGPRPLMECIETLTHPEDIARVRRAVSTTLEAGSRLDVEFRNLLPGGDERWLRSVGEIVRDADGLACGIRGTLMDVTGERERQAVRTQFAARMKQAEKLEAVGALARGIAHDFNNLLGTVSGYAELALEARREDPRLRADLEHVLDAAGRASRLVTRLLVFSRQQRPNPVPLRLAASLREALALVRAALPPGIEIHEALDGGAPEVLGDETQMLQVMMNLCSNALDAMKGRGGVLAVALEPFAVDRSFAASHPGLEVGPHARISVSDSGCGIDPAHVARVFEPFFTTKPPGEGTGLGLPVVQDIVREYRGAVEIESVRGEGTVVHLYLPALSQAGSEDAEPQPTARREAGQRVMLVDDERALAELGRRRLVDLGHAPVVYTDSRRALAAFRERPHDFDLLVTDQAMPNLTGIELARELRRIRPALPVVLVSGYGDDLTAESLSAAGVCRHLRKPVALEALAEAISAAAAGKRSA